MTMQIAPARRYTPSEHQEIPADLPLVVEFTSTRAHQRPIAARAGGIELPGLGRLPVRAVDIEAYPDLRRRFRVDLLPTFIVILGGREVARLIGPHSRRELTAGLRRSLDPRVVRVEEPPSPRARWNDFTTRLWGFSAG